MVAGNTYEMPRLPLKIAESEISQHANYCKEHK
jgi:hypothetical protein